MPESNTPNNKLSDDPPSDLVVDLVNRQTRYPIQEERLREVAQQILLDAGYPQGHLSLAVVDDAEMHQLNRQYLQHDYPTDVLSFLLEESGERIEGEVIVSADTAQREALRWDWLVNDELLLYIVHGTLHLTGMDDHEPEDRLAMRRAEAMYLARWGLQHRYDSEEVGGDPGATDTSAVEPACPGHQDRRQSDGDGEDEATS
jgi:probable rRNA maturation factor